MKTFAAFGVHGATVVTALTAQSTRGVHAVADVEPAFVAAELDAVLDDLDVAAGKTGMLGRIGVIEVVGDRLRARPLPHLVVDPVLVASTGAPLLEAGGVEALRRVLLPLATLITPNLAEAGILTGRRVHDPPTMRDAAQALIDLGCRAALVTGGHLPGVPLDVLHDGTAVHELAGPRVGADSPHGTGCALSAAITACLVRGEDLATAVATAKQWVARAIAASPPIGRGVRPLAIPPRS